MKNPFPRFALALLLLSPALSRGDEASGPAPGSLVAKADALREAGTLMTADAFAEQLKSPQAAPVTLPPVATTPLTGRALAQKAAAAYLRAGWYFQCSKCDRWHTNFAGAYAVATDTAATAFHVMQRPPTMRPGQGHPILVRGESEVLAVTAVIAADEEMDAVVLRVSTQDLQPLAFAESVEVGDSVWCLSDPRGERGYFSSGIVNRLFVKSGSKGAAKPREQRMNVSTDWAPGSSGSAVLDACGNVVGHVGSIRAIFTPPQGHPENGKSASKSGPPTATAMNLHEAIPAKSVRTLLPR